MGQYVYPGKPYCHQRREGSGSIRPCPPVWALPFFPRRLLSLLKQSKSGYILNIGSLFSKVSLGENSVYAATKHAVIAFSRCLMLEERKNGVRVLAICPGSVTTEFSAPDQDETKQKRKLQTEDISSSIIHAIRLPQRAMISEIDIRPTNP